MGNVGDKIKLTPAPSPPEIQPAASYSSVLPLHQPIQEEPEYEALVIGTSLHRHISSVRRFFCLLASFDLLFVFLIWVINIKVRYEKHSYADAFTQEVLRYTISQSLFDIVVLSFLRLFLILAVYCIITISHWWMVAVTTSLSSAFLIAKVFLYKWGLSNDLIPVIMLIFSFILAWAEAWFLDIKVLPSERRAAKLLAWYINQNASNINMQHGPASFVTDDEDFYSPPGSDTESLNPEETFGSIKADSPEPPTLSLQDQIYKNELDQNIELGLQLLSSEHWKTEKIYEDIILQSMRMPKIDKLFKYLGFLDASVDRVKASLLALSEGAGSLPRWNSLLRQASVLHKIDDHTDVVHIVAYSRSQSLVNSRDFVCLRGYQQKADHSQIISAFSIQYPIQSPASHTIRGQINHCLFVLTPRGPDKCQFQWLLSTNPKGWLPDYMSNAEITSAMVRCIKDLQRLCTTVTTTTP